MAERFNIGIEININSTVQLMWLLIMTHFARAIVITALMGMITGKIPLRMELHR